MFTVQVPNIDFDTQTSLTVGPDHDDILGTAGNDLVIGAVSTLPNQLTTLGPADIIRGGSDGEDMLSITFTGDGPQAVGWLSRDMDVFQVRAFNDGTATLNAIDMLGTSTLWFDNNTGDSEFQNVQNVVDLVATGGTFDTRINYAAGVAGGADQDQEILVQGTGSESEETEIYIEGGVQNLWLQANGAASFVEVESDATTVMVMGTAPSLELDVDNGLAEVATFDASQFAGNLKAWVDVGNGSGIATVDTSSGADDLDLDSNSNSTVQINTRAGADYVEVDNAYRVELLLGNGSDTADIGTDGDYIGSGGVDVNSGKGEDDLDIYTWGGAFIRTGDGSDQLALGYVGGNADVKTGWGFDVVTNTGGVNGFLTIDLGLGDDTLDTNASGGASVIAGEGDDSVTLTSNGNVTVKAGAGNNTMDVSVNGGGFPFSTSANFFAGDGTDELTFQGTGYYDSLQATLRGGNDTVNVQGGVTGTMNLLLGAGDDTVNLGAQALSSSDTITGEGGNDILTADDLGSLNSAGAFANTEMDEVRLSATSNDVFSGETSGANAAGVVTYDFLSSTLNTTTTMNDMVSGVTLNLTDSDNNWISENLTLDLTGSGGVANLNLQSSSFFNYSLLTNVTLTDVGTMNVTSDHSVSYLGVGSGFNGDSDLTTLNLIGYSFAVFGLQASNLSTIDASAAPGGVFLNLVDVADNITVTTGSGNDQIDRSDASTNYTINTGSGSDSVYAGGGNDNINLGDGDDRVQFASTDLDDFDTVEGGSGTGDTIEITSGGLTENDDDFFFGITGIETWLLNDSTDTLTLGNIAQSSGMQRINLGNGNNSVTLAASYASALEITLGSGASNDTVNAGASGATLTVRAESNDLDGLDVITGGTGGADELQITAVNGTSNLNGMTAVEKVTVVVDYGGSLTIDAVDSNVAAGETLTVTGSNNSIFSPTGALVFNGGAETDGKFVVSSGYGNDSITTGAGADSITTGEGDDVVFSGLGNDTVNAGGGSDVVVGDLGNDSIDGGAGDDVLFGDGLGEAPTSGGTDTINAGSGADSVFGGLGADIINVGTGDGAVDVVYYTSVAESAGAIVDQVSGFLGGAGGDVLSLAYSGLSAIGGQAFVGNGSSFGQSQALLINGDGIVQVVFQVDDQVLWADVNDDGALNADDLQIHLIGVTALDAGNLALA